MSWARAVIREWHIHFQAWLSEGKCGKEETGSQVPGLRRPISKLKLWSSSPC